ncbi:MAG: DUF427 domain-containing protein [Woeseiaceae bacterium]|nr:DUF427 domain-containing protein [Woeseiaceae bacterium]
MKATWNGSVIAESKDTIVIEGNHYFPADSIDRAYFEDSPKTTVCGWKGTANYYDVVVDGETNAAAAWYYPTPKDAAAEIRNYVAFWQGVEVSE